MEKVAPNSKFAGYFSDNFIFLRNDTKWHYIYQHEIMQMLKTCFVYYFHPAKTQTGHLAIVYFCRPQKLIQTYPPVFGNFSQDFYSKNCPNYDTYIDLHQVHKHRP